jgi:hypothetical protein
MSYTINFTDLSKAARNIFISVPDNGLNTSDTPLTLVGRNYPAYGQFIASDLVHLLENFANSSRPSKNIEGQIWFDTSDPNNKKLKVFDGSDYAPVAGVHRTPTSPLGNTPVYSGDIWVDTSNNQLSIFNGSSFTLIGPNYSSALKTGSYATTSTAIDGTIHNIVINYVNDNAVEIISQENFTPIQVIDGFSNIKAGVNISGKNLGTTQSPSYAIFNGVAYQSSNLQQTIPSLQTVSANNFVRNDIDQKVAGQLTVGTDAGIKIGQDPTFVLQRNSQYNATFLNTYDKGRFTFQIVSNNIANTLLTLDGNTGAQGTSPAQVKVHTANLPGVTKAYGTFEVTSGTTMKSIVVTSTLSNIDVTSDNALYVKGGLGVDKTLVVTGEHILVGPLSVGRTEGPLGSESVASIIPGKTNQYDIGSQSLKWNNVFATTFNGFLAGNASTASKLVGNTFFGLSGDVYHTALLQYDGTPNTYTMNVKLDKAAIYGRSYVPKVSGVTVTGPTFADDDFIMVYRPSAQPDVGVQGNGTLYKESRYDFLKDLYEYRLSTGAIVPFAQDTAPPGWLLCDGATYDGGTGTPYNNLFQIIRQKFGGQTNTQQFNVPNLLNELSWGAGYIKYYIKT